MKKVYYGVFYKSHGQWTGPYRNQILNPKEVDSYVRTGNLKRVARFLKSKVSLRKLKLKK